MMRANLLPTASRPRLPEGLRAFVLALALLYLAVYLFLILMGAWTPSNAVVPTIAAALSVVIAVWHAYEIGVDRRAHRVDQRIYRARERRGF
jgi:lipopolysaccharide export LptBFGC system permease protein LptF